MYITSGSKIASIKEKQIDAPVQKLYIVGHLNDEVIREHSNPGLYIVGLLDKALLSIQRQTPNGAVHMLSPMGIGSLAEICSNQEGHINLKYKASEIQAYRLDFELIIDLSAYNAVKLTGGDFMLLSLDLSQSVIENIEVYGVESPVIGSAFTKYTQHKVNEDTIKSISLVGVNTLALPRTGFEQLDLIFPDRTVTYKKDIKAIMNCIENVVCNYVALNLDENHNGEVYPTVGLNPGCAAQTYYDGIQYYTLGVAGAIEAKVLYTQDSKLVTVQTIN
jgi:hypothetical protein